jgi:Fe-S cluster biogenesis protein NfuA
MGTTSAERAIMEEQIKTKLEEIRTMLQADGGDLELVAIEDKTVKLRLKGACGGCPHAVMTIKQGIERMLRQGVDHSITVERVM